MKAVLRLAALSLLFAGSAFALTGERMPEMTLEQMTPAQRTIAEAIMSGPRGRMSGPFNAWLRSPVLADRLQKVGEYVRFNTSLDKRINEMAILMTAQAWGAQYEWYAHKRLALTAGVSQATVDSIAAGTRPTSMTADEVIVYNFCTELLNSKNVSDAAFAATKNRLGERGVAASPAAPEPGVPPRRIRPRLAGAIENCESSRLAADRNRAGDA